MIIKVNCKYNDKGAWCTNKNIKRSLFGIGARCCSEYNNISCDLKESRKLKGKLIIKKLTDLNNKRFFFDGYIWYKKEDGKGIKPLNYIETRIMKKILWKDNGY